LPIYCKVRLTTDDWETFPEAAITVKKVCPVTACSTPLAVFEASLRVSPA